MEIKSIELVLENCEVIEIFSENLAFLTIEDIVKNYYLNANMVDDFLVANEISLGIKKDFTYLSNSGNSVSVFDRLLYNDIAGIDINYVNGSNEYIYTKYDEGVGNSNLNQLTIEQDNGMAIIICADELKRRSFWKRNSEQSMTTLFFGKNFGVGAE